MNPKNRTFLIVAGVVVLIIAAALVAVLATGGSDDSGDSSASGDSGAEIEQTRPVEVTGEPLAPFEDPAADPAVGQASPVVTGAGLRRDGDDDRRRGRQADAARVPRPLVPALQP